MSKLLGEAISLAADVHKYQVDKAGEPYILHCLEVMKRTRKSYDRLKDGYVTTGMFREPIQIAALLHDILEDMHGTVAENHAMRTVIDERYGSQVLDVVSILTRRKTEYYFDYIERVAQNSAARLVKLADLSHNLEAWRIPENDITNKDYERWNKYHRAFVRLMRGE